MNNSPSALPSISAPPRTTTPPTANSERDRVAYRLRVGDGGDRDRPDELDRHGLAEVDAVDAR